MRLGEVSLAGGGSDIGEAFVLLT